MDNKTTRCSAVICAAGRGTRAGFAKNKLLMPLGGAPALYHTLKKFDIPEIDEVVVAASQADYAEVCALAAPFGYVTVTGGETRSESVKRALEAVHGDIVLIHDGARPFVDRQTILSCISSVKQYGSGVCAVAFTDTAVCAQNGEVFDRPDRSCLYSVQTPQGFFTADIRRAYALAGDAAFTDDSAVYEAYIAPPRLCAGDAGNIKLTYRSDFAGGFPPPALTPPCADGLKIGFGVDVHAFGAGSSVTLAGVKIPCDGALIAHSDGDVVLHAVTDALLSAAGLKDIGHYFPDTDASLRGADSALFVRQAVKYIKAAGYVPCNVSVSVQAEKPRLAPYIDAMTQNIAALTGVERQCAAVAAGTCEKLGFVGEGRGIAAYCAVLLKKSDGDNSNG